MNDNTTATTLSRISLLLPYASLALTLAALSIGAPSKIARSLHRASLAQAGFQTDADIHDEPFLFPAPSAGRFNRAAPPLAAGAWILR